MAHSTKIDPRAGLGSGTAAPSGAINPTPSRVPCRSELQSRIKKVIRRGARHKADLLLVDLGEGPLLVKDFRGTNWWRRLLGRLQIGREYRAYRWLGELDGIPKLIGRVDAYALAVEWIDGQLLATAPDRIAAGKRYVAGIRVVMEALHAAGLAHLDLRSNKNVLIRRDGRVVLLDFASAVWFRPGSLLQRLLLPRLQVRDISGYLKWKRTLQAGPLTADEQACLRRQSFLSSLWFPNRKHRLSGKRMRDR